MTSNGRPVGAGARAVSIQQTGGLLIVGVRVMPSAARTEVRGVYGDRLKVAVNAPPEAGKANARLLQALAGWLGLRMDQLALRAGHAGRDKVVAFSGIDASALREKLDTLLHDAEPIK